MSTTQRSKTRGTGRDAKVVPGTTNVFKDLARSDAGEAFAKVELAYEICALIERMHLTQTQSAALLGTDRARVSNLTRGCLAEFSIDRLFHFLNKLGQDVDVTIRPKRQANGRVH